MQGWQPDPYGIHELRYISQDKPTRLVKNGNVETYDEPPDEPRTYDEPPGESLIVGNWPPDSGPPTGTPTENAVRNPFQAPLEYWRRLPRRTVFLVVVATVFALVGVAVFAASGNERHPNAKSHHDARYVPPRTAGADGQSSPASSSTGIDDDGTATTTAPSSDPFGSDGPSSPNGSSGTTVPATGGTNTSIPLPLAQTPESPTAIFLPIAALGLLAISFMRKRRATAPKRNDPRTCVALVERRDPAG